jgi:hypothetical protein
MSIDQIGLIVGAVLSLIILSYLIGDNFLYRFVTHVLVGVGAAYIVVIVVADVLVPQMVQPIVQFKQMLENNQPGPIVIAGFGLVGCILLLFKGFPRLAGGGNIPIGYLVGVGAAVALGGALFGTLSAQIIAAAQVPAAIGDKDAAVKILLGVLALAGTLATLISFGFYRVARGGLLSGVNAIGRFFLSAALGATFALVYVASVSLLIDRVQAIADVVNMLLKLPKP